MQVYIRQDTDEVFRLTHSDEQRPCEKIDWKNGIRSKCRNLTHQIIQDHPANPFQAFCEICSAQWIKETNAQIS